VIKKPRHQIKFRVDPELARSVQSYCASRNITETALCVEAVQRYLAGTTLHDVQLRRLDRIARELSRLGVAIELLGETLGAFVQLWLAHNPEIDERDKPAAQRDVVRRYQRFVAYVLRAIRDGRGTLLHQLVDPQAQLGAADELERAREAAGAQMREANALATPEQASEERL